MALQHYWRYRSHNTLWKSGSIYTFHYTSFINDPEPTLLFLNVVKGIHPNTGHQHRYVQGINLTYIPRSKRRQFVKDWKSYMSNNRLTPQVSWSLILKKYPYMKHAIRRYNIKPVYLIQKVREIPLEQMDKVVISTWSKDFSKKVAQTLLNKFRGIMGRNRKKSK